MPQITTFLSFKDEAEEAMNHYLSVFKTSNSRVLSISRYGEAGPGQPGKVMVCEFELDGHRFAALNGGPGLHCGFNPSISLLVNCETQEEVDHYWEGLSAGGEHGQCGWLKDKFSVSWQVVPSVLGKLLSSEDGEASQRVMRAMRGMTKLDIEALRTAYGPNAP